jgi:hypothetical protein
MTMPLLELGAGAYAGEEAEEHGLLDTSSAAGWAFLFAIVGFVAVCFALGRGRGFMAGVTQALGFGFIVAATEMWIHFLARSFALQYPDSPLAGGIAIDL